MQPDRIAIKTSYGVISYAELNNRAHLIARNVLALSEETSAPVCILSSDAAEQAASMLGILKAGKAFVLLDSRLPPDRLRWTIEDSQTRLIIHQKQHESLLKKVGLDRRFLDLNSIGPSDSMENIEVAFRRLTSRRSFIPPVPPEIPRESSKPIAIFCKHHASF